MTQQTTEIIQRLTECRAVLEDRVSRGSASEREIKACQEAAALLDRVAADHSSPHDPPDEWFRAQAREEFAEEGVIEVDDDACVSRGDGAGAYVHAWVWVDRSESLVGLGTASGRVLEASRRLLAR
jgi:hypothetical protein